MLFDLVGTLCSLLSTYYFIRLNSKAWIVGIAATCVNGALYWYKGIYADMTLEGFYFFSMGYGWYKWQISTKNYFKHSVLLGQLSTTQWLILFFSCCTLFALIYTILALFTQSTVILLDTLTTTLSLAAQWLMCHKIIGTWILWFLTDALYAWMYLSKSLPFHTFLMIIYTGMAFIGYVSWTRRAPRPSVSAHPMTST